MKRLMNTAFIYAIAALAGGVFYREFTKLNGFTGQSSLGVLHTHLFMLGMFAFLLLTLLDNSFGISSHRNFGRFFLIYNAGVIIAAGTMVWRGVVQVLGVPLSKAVDASISGIAGVGHILVAVGLVMLFLMLKKRVSAKA